MDGGGAPPEGDEAGVSTVGGDRGDANGDSDGEEAVVGALAGAETGVTADGGVATGGDDATGGGELFGEAAGVFYFLNAFSFFVYYMCQISIYKLSKLEVNYP
ncbi:hypothetical protein A4A49_30317 [Nicotiana attenuata]|uniref:Uncharacterized protein n=1 Tax=Nicotiana attenuata TaxID=49451 RepID=A0A1J6K227_NICAT|nr:hypothetical protein A4A49_30317 [Nicotiana attenuata]